MLALVLAAQSFDDSFGVPFAAFATIRIRGALTDALRSMDWAARAVRTKARQIQTVSDKLAAVLRRTPTRAEIAQAMGVAVSEIDAVDADVRRGSVASIQALSPEAVEESLPSTTDSPETLLLKREQIGYLHDAIAELPERLRVVVEQYFFGQRKMAVIAEELGVTESRVSQLRSEALKMLRAALNGMDARSSGAHAAPCGNPVHRTYAKAVDARSTLADRLSLTTVLAEPRHELATLN
jgi:RNA polymerase sigma factor for flagellar operon FliA